ncbi:FMN-dependent NADH-azoreductase [Mycolicibacter minnesotensis]|uniref:FMN dependent NADH:quinone oxidoreductase n=1 Tax=Mycolicibacter minnesotensis TaxID=1118379 RepID=A0A7I7R0C9_9MYCO|nr:NAD(P)H-dependent oxidoreductase [Mycolicibacter minnesotensis]ORB01661.1 FMN-dependent NADH-azoreductase [Mycolicibacter minnesotensis]BBY31962.1 FMN-dependent NADH-azoreductase 1 [Mycolicibacter minnesotensis]
MKTLWVEASPKQEHSLSSALAQEFLDAATVAVVGDVERYSVWSDDAITFGREAAFAKFAPLYGERRTPEQKQIWSQILAEIERVRAFDRLVVSSPMWNWHVPHALKAWIDVIVQPIASFTLNERGEHVGTLGQGKPLQLILTRSSAYDGDRPDLQDFQRPYLEYVFTMLGYTVETLVFEPTTRWTAEEREQMREAALAEARRAGEELAT